MEFRQGVPPEIEEKYARLKQKRRAIEKLSQECEQLEKELKPYSSSLSAINKCPQEILVDIFQLYLADNSRLIRRLLLVCKFWYSTAVQTPMLWINIPIMIDTRDIDAKEVADSISPRIDAFLRYSGNLPLHIVIDLEYLNDIWRFIQAQEGHIHSRISYDIHLDWLDPVGANFSTITRAPLDKSWNPSHVVDLLRRLTGQRGELMERWATLKLLMTSGSDPDFISLLWDVFTGPTPHLTDLRIVSDEPMYGQDNPIFPNLSSLKRLEVQNRVLFEVLAESDNLSRSQIEHLEVDCSYSHEFDVLNKFTSLRSLVTVAYSHGWPNYRRHHTTLRLPLLESISFVGGDKATEGVIFDFPRLRNVRIVRGPVEHLMGIPNLDPKALIWGIAECYRRVWSSEAMKIALADLLRKYQKLEEVIISAHVYKALATVIGELRKSGALPKLLRLVYVLDDNDKAKVVKTLTVEELLSSLYFTS